MEYAQPTPVGEEVVMPETATQCWDLYERDALLPLGEFAREAGFECPVLMTAEAIRLMAKDGLYGGPKAFREELVRRLGDVREATRQFALLDAYVIRVEDQDHDIEELFVRQNFESREPFVLITERV